MIISLILLIKYLNKIFFYHDLFLFLCFCTFIWLQGALNNGNLIHVLFFYFFFFFICLFFHTWFFFLSFYLCFCTFIWLQGDLRDNWIKVIFYFFFLDSNLFSVLSIKDNHFFSIIIHYLIFCIFLLLAGAELFIGWIGLAFFVF